ncbi:hypothetical protein JFU04_08780 [Pseudomonas sp. TH21]|nr:hypothetical protein [Pseudomonas sp. TH21]MBK5476195.1 hypothetical protein [Pseudomonas sp. TH21]
MSVNDYASILEKMQWLSAFRRQADSSGKHAFSDGQKQQRPVETGR